MKLDIELPLLKSLMAMAAMVEARDAYTGGHLWRVSRFSQLLGEKIGLPKEEVFQVGIGGFLHDIGKVGVPDAILNKPDRLTDEEYIRIQAHPQVGADLVAMHPLADLALPHIHQHHERPDGMGYPYGLSDGEIPLQSKIVGLVDAFDAMTSTRPYRAGMPIDRALSILEAEKGDQFDPRLTDAFVLLGKAGKLDGIVGHSAEGSMLAECPTCGPVIPTHHHHDGDVAHCPVCSGEARVHAHGDRFEIEPMGRFADPEALTPTIDWQAINSQLTAVPASISLAA